MMDLARQRIVNRIPAWRRALNSFLPFRREAGGPDSSLRRDHAPMRAVRVSLTPFWVLWVLSSLLSLALGMVLMFALQGGAG